ncbi:MAG: hypothetical protein CRN43_12595 [Candidatus Nephrothrix sp. EaCA]|nr:MAG: hypothetical protein CRN43_12595 [Candidatus Nephrothrix sp. EaCA]
MSNYSDQIDEYITGRLGEAEKADFELRMNADSALKSEVQMKQLIASGIQRARARELKAMLNGVPVAVTAGLLTKIFTPMKAFLAVATITASVSTWFYINKKLNPEQNPKIKEVQEPIIQERKDTLAPFPLLERNESKGRDKRRKHPKKMRTAVVIPPAIFMPNISPENTAAKETESMAVKKDTALSENGHSFLLEVMEKPPLSHHPLSYKIEKNTLVLYGDPGKGPCKILDLSRAQNELYLFFADSYYKLDPNQNEVKELEPITNPKLIDQLTELRDKQND